MSSEHSDFLRAQSTIFSQNLKISGITVGSRTMFEDMSRAIVANDIHPVIDQRFGLEDAQEAFRTMESASHFGKIVLNHA